MQQFSQPASSCRLLDFDTASVVPGFVNDTWILAVGGDKPYANMSVELVPMIYVRQPEYWGIEVVGCVSGIVLPAIVPYDASLQLDHVIGTKGIEVIGATTRRVFELPFRRGDPGQSLQTQKPVYQINKLELHVHSPVSVSVDIHGSARTTGWRNFRIKRRPGGGPHEYDVVGTPGGGGDRITPFVISQNFPAFGGYTVTFHSETNKMEIKVPNMDDPT